MLNTDPVMPSSLSPINGTTPTTLPTTLLTTPVFLTPDFSKKVKGSSTKKHTAEKSAKEEAYFNAIIDNNVDVLIDPIYSVTSTKKILPFAFMIFLIV